MRSGNRAQLFDELEQARLEMVHLVRRVIDEKIADGLEVLAVEIVDAILLDRPDLVQKLALPGPSRVWYYLRETLSLEDTPWLMRGGDEYGNDTVAVRLPFGGQVVLNVTFPMKKYVRPLNQA